MSTVKTFPLTRLTSGTLAQVGVDMVIAAAGVDLPGDGHSSYSVALHDDGSHCSTECGCVGVDDRTRVWEDCSVEHGEWTWRGTRYFLIGLRRSGPTETEAQLRERAEVLAENLEAEKGNHQVTDADLRHCIRNLETLQGQLEDSKQSLRLAKAAHLRAEDDLAAARKRIRALTAGAAVLALALVVAVVWAVIA